MNQVARQPSVLLVDDDRHILESMGDWLRSLGYHVDLAARYDEAIARIDQKAYDVLLCDIRLGDGAGDGFGVLAHTRRHRPDTTVILITGYGTPDMARDTVEAGGFDMLTKPLIDDELELTIGRALAQQKMLRDNEELQKQLNDRYGLDNIIGRDHQMMKIYDMIESVADSRTTVLITGESGTGKSMIARAVHRRSARRDRPFVEIACGALPETLLESELFGHVAGAFTGTAGDKMGKFKQADGGTIFLDEISTASPGMQVKLLRVLQELQFEQVGGTETFNVDTRVILATNEDLAEAVADGRFRQDLYYRVNVINISLPALRSRISDIPLLAGHFLERVCDDAGKHVRGFSDAARETLQRYRWPGNVRELQNVIERAVLLGKNSRIEVEDLPEHLASSAPVSIRSQPGHTLKEALEGPERQIIRNALDQHDWNRNVTAEVLGINRTTLYKKMKRLGLESPAGVAMR